MKKILLALLVFVVITTSVFGIVFHEQVGVFFSFKKIYAESDKEEAETQGKKDAEEFKAYIKTLLEDLQSQLNNMDVNNVDDLNNILDNALKDLFDKVDDQQEDVVSLLKIKLESLKSLKITYAEKLKDLKEQLKSINDTIAQIIASAEDDNVTIDISGFEYAKAYLETDIVKYTSLINSITEQIQELETEIALKVAL